MTLKSTDHPIMQAFTATQEGKVEEAERLYKIGLKIQPEHVIANNNLAILLQNQRRFDEAIQYYKKAIEFEPDFVLARYNLGVLFKTINRFDEAIECFKKAIEFKPGFAEAHNQLGLILNKLERLEQAEECFKKVIEFKPGFAEGYNNLSVVLNKLNRNEEAKGYCKKAIELNPKHHIFHNSMSSILRKLGKIDEAVINLEKGMILDPDFTHVINFINNGDWEKSKEALKIACLKKPSNTSVYTSQFIKLSCMYYYEILNKGDVKGFIQIFVKLVIVAERNNDLNKLIKSLFESIDINSVLLLTKQNDKILIMVSYSQYKFLIEDYSLSEKLAAANIEDAKSLIENKKTEDKGWMIVGRSLVQFKNKDFARKKLDNLLFKLGVIK